jgi:hypothetical protein
MNVSSKTLIDALASYAVLLNRPQWLDPAKSLLQEQVWSRMIQRADGVGEIRLDDFERAIEEHLDGNQPHTVTPSHVVNRAAELARHRTVLADRMAAEHAAGNLLFSETSQLAVSGDVAQFDRSVREAVRAVVQSGRPNEEIERLVDAIESTQVMVTAATEIEQLVSGDDDSDEAAVINEWLNQ